MYQADHHLLDEEDHLQHALTKGNKRNAGFDRRKSKGSVANHLLNFSLPVRNNDPPSFVRKKKGPPPRTRDEFLHANYRFVVSPLVANESPALYDLDALTEWDKIEQVIVANDATNTDQRCPICLDTLRAPKITRCGHAYCWHCILTYLSMTENYWRRCPMCFDSVKKHDLRSVLIDRQRTIPAVGSTATFHFVHRSRSSWFPHLPAAADSSVAKGKMPSVHCANANYSRILESTPAYLQSMIEAEMHDLHALAAEAQSSGDDHALPVIQEALTYCEKRLTKLVAAASDGVDADASPAVPRSTATKAATDSNEDEPPYTFYQLHNGHTAILHPLCMRALTREFGPDNSFPHDITAPVLEIEHVVMNDDVRKRFRYMAHLPPHCDLFLVEVDMAGIVSPETQGHFQTEFKKRARARQQAKRHQKNDKKKPRSDSFEVSLMLQLALDNDAHYPQLQNVPAGAPPDDDAGDDLDRSDATDESPYNSPYASFASVTTNQGHYPSFNLGGRDDSGATAPGWPNVANAAMAVPFNFDELKKESSQNGKKAKKGVSLFASSQRRSYR